MICYSCCIDVDETIEIRGENAMAEHGRPVLTVDGGLQDGMSIPMEQAILKMGRDDDHHVVVRGPGVSRDHAEIVRTDSGYHLRDRNSTNGTFVNGRSIGLSSHLLAPGDVIRLGSSKVTLVFRDDVRKTVEIRAAELLSDKTRDEEVPNAKEPPIKGTPRQRVMQYLLAHPEGANFKTLQEIAGVSRRQLPTVLGSLVDSRMVRSDHLLFFAITKPR
jgi:pSer/pThr/pTyr-binding forkhead associated (FHA) protein